MSRFGQGGEGTSALLQKVNSQLRGEKKDDENDDGLGAYLSGLGKKSSMRFKAKTDSIDWDKFDELSDKSISDVEYVEKQAEKPASTGSKFLKKKPQQDARQPTSFKKTTAAAKSSALSKASTLSNQYESKPRAELVRMLSDSDMDMSFSTEVNHLPVQLGDASELVPATRPRSRTPEKSKSDDSAPIGKTGSRFLKKPTRKNQTPSPKELQKPAPSKESRQEQPPKHFPKPQATSQFRAPSIDSKPVPSYLNDNDDSSSMSFGKGGARFLKKKPVIQEAKASPKSPKESKPKVKKPVQGEKRDMFTLKSSLKYSTEIQYDTSEESLQDFIHNLDASNKPAPGRQTKGKVRTPRTPTRSMTPLDEIKEEEERHSDATVSSDDSFKSASDREHELYSSDSLASTVLYIDHDDTSCCEDEVNVFDVDALGTIDIASSFEADQLKPISPKSPRSPKRSPKLAKTENKSSAKKTEKGKSKLKKQRAVPDTTNVADDFFSNFGLQTVEDLLGKGRSLDEGSEIGTDIEEQDSHTDRSPSPLRSILSPSPKADKTPRSSRSRVHYSLEEITEIRSRSPSPEVITTARKSKSEPTIYAEDFDPESIRSESSIRTEQPTSDIDSVSERLLTAKSSARSSKYSDDFMSATESKWSSTRRDLRRSESMESYYSDTFSDYSDSVTERTRTFLDKHKKKSVEVQTDPGDLMYRWDNKFIGHPIVPPGLGLGSVDPSPIATHVVTAEALETLTAYSPSVIALNEMLKQQIKLTENFIAIQTHLHENLIRNAQPDFSYTTLQEAKSYIKRHRKPRLTFDAALRQVKEDMGMS